MLFYIILLLAFALLIIGPTLILHVIVAWRSRFIEPQDHVWMLDVEPSVFYSGCWADPAKWGEQPEVYSSYYSAFRAARRYVGEHPYGAVRIKHRCNSKP